VVIFVLLRVGELASRWAPYLICLAICSPASYEPTIRTSHVHAVADGRVLGVSLGPAQQGAAARYRTAVQLAATAALSSS
jgi:hypothetical protein